MSEVSLIPLDLMKRPPFKQKSGTMAIYNTGPHQKMRLLMLIVDLFSLEIAHLKI